MQGLSAAVEDGEKNWYPCLRRGSHGVDGIDPKGLQRFFERVLHRFDQRQAPVPDLPLAFQYLFVVIERVEGVSKFPCIGGKDVRAELGDHLLDDHREPGDLLGESDLLFGLKIEALRKVPGFLKDTAGPGMGVLDVGAALPLEVQCLLPVKDRALLRRYLHDIIADGGKTDRFCN